MIVGLDAELALVAFQTSFGFKTYQYSNILLRHGHEIQRLAPLFADNDSIAALILRLLVNELPENTTFEMFVQESKVNNSLFLSDFSYKDSFRSALMLKDFKEHKLSWEKVYSRISINY